MSIVEKPQPKEKSLSDYINMFTNQIPDRETIEARSRILTGRTEQFTEEDDKTAGFKLDRGPLLSRTGLFQPPDPFESTAEETSIQNLEDAGVPYYYLDPEIGKSDAIKKEEAKNAAVKEQAAVEKAANQAVKAAAPPEKSGNFLTAEDLNNLLNKRGKPLSDSYDTLDKSFNDYLTFLEKKKGEGAEKLSEAEEAREARLFAELAATSARFAGQAGPGGFLAKLNQAALPSIAELKNIQKDFRKERQAAKDIEGDILKDKLNINLAKAKLDMERSKLASENNLRAAKAYAERTADAYGLDAKEAYDSLDKSLKDSLIDPYIRATAYDMLAKQIERGENPNIALSRVTGFVKGQGGIKPDGPGRTRTTQAALNDAQQAAKKKLDAARS
jgi:hypothetical protein